MVSQSEQHEATTSDQDSDRSDSTPSNPASAGESSASSPAQQAPESIHSMTTHEWRERYERDGGVDLWLEEEFNAGSRLKVGHQ